MSLTQIGDKSEKDENSISVSTNCRKVGEGTHNFLYSKVAKVETTASLMSTAHCKTLKMSLLYVGL
jgi:hypothetical protein